MQELRIDLWCDCCNADGQRTPVAESFLVYVTSFDADGRKPVPKRLDLCDVHAKPVKEVAEIMKLGTIPRSPKAKAPEPEPAPPEPEPVKDATGPAATPDSAPDAAVTGSPGTDELLPGKRTCPVCGKVLTRSQVLSHLYEVHSAKRIKQPRKCPDCGKSLPRPHSMVIHRMASHGYDHQAEIVATIKEK